MGSQTLLSSAAAGAGGGGGGGGAGAGSSGPSHWQAFNPIPRQPSIYSLTLEEFQNTINDQRKDFGSMNMEEFIKNVWTAEESQAMAAAMASSDINNGSSNGLVRQPSLHRQGSLSLARTVSIKTVEEVWREIQQKASNGKQQPQQQAPPERQATTLGEMTLEDFLVRAGVVREEPLTQQEGAPNGNGAMPIYPPPSPSSAVTAMVPAPFPPSVDFQPEWMSYGSRQQHQHQQLLQQAEAAAALEAAKRGVPTSSYMLPTGNHMFDSLPDASGLGSGLALSPGVSEFSTHSKKRTAEAVIEKTVERRQKRMIKNRESAARSRARKQAYTCELEALVTQLKEENARLKRHQAAECHIQETRDPQQSQVRVLRRNRSWPSSH